MPQSPTYRRFIALALASLMGLASVGVWADVLACLCMGEVHVAFFAPAEHECRHAPAEAAPAACCQAGAAVPACHLAPATSGPASLAGCEAGTCCDSHLAYAKADLLGIHQAQDALPALAFLLALPPAPLPVLGFAQKGTCLRLLSGHFPKGPPPLLGKFHQFGRRVFIQSFLC